MKAHTTNDVARSAAVLTRLGLLALLLLASVQVARAADAGGLRADVRSLAAREQAATLELYALETELARARTELSTLEQRRAALAREQAAARAQLAVAKQAVTVSQAQLAELVRALYQQPGNDPVAVVLGASSLEEALAGLDGISRAAGQNNRIVEQAGAARTRLAALGARLATQDRELDRLAAAAKARSSALAATASERRGFIVSLRNRRELGAAQIASIEAQARAAETRTAAIAVASSPPPDLAPQELSAPVVRASGPGTLTVTSTGYALKGRTATGIPTGPGVVAVDPAVIPLGTRLTIPGYGVGVAADTGGAVQGNTIDVWFPTTAQALAWGRRTVTVTIH